MVKLKLALTNKTDNNQNNLSGIYNQNKMIHYT